MNHGRRCFRCVLWKRHLTFIDSLSNRKRFHAFSRHSAGGGAWPEHRQSGFPRVQSYCRLTLEFYCRLTRGLCSTFARLPRGFRTGTAGRENKLCFARNIPVFNVPDPAVSWPMTMENTKNAPLRNHSRSYTDYSVINIITNGISCVSWACYTRLWFILSLGFSFVCIVTMRIGDRFCFISLSKLWS